MPTPLAADRLISADRFVKEAQEKGYQIVYEATWPNGAGWIALSGPTSGGRIALLVKFYPDGKFTSETVGEGSLARSA